MYVLPYTQVEIGSTVKWESSRKPVGKVVHMFNRNMMRYAVVERSRDGEMVVMRVYEKLQVVDLNR